MKRLVLAAVVLFGFAHTAGAAERLRVIANGTFSAGPAGFDATHSFTEFLETARIDAHFKADSAAGFDGGLQVNVFKGLGAFVAYSQTRRNESGTFQARLPHPLYFGRFREASGDLSSAYRYKESAIHADLAVGGVKGHLDYAFFAGVSRFTVEADLVETLRYDHAYPYDTVTVTEVPPKTTKGTPTGFNAGARLDYRFGASGHFGLGALVRFSRATAKLKPADDSTVNVDAGGFQGGLGLRLYF